MREIKFRGKDKRTNEWIYGSLVVSEGKYFIFPWVLRQGIPTQLEEVYPESVGQSIGCKDKNGKEVYEGDVTNCTTGCPHQITHIQEHGGTFGGGMPTFYLSGLNAGYAWVGEEEVIGNIYENQELIKK